jgi:hypothetical protein
LPRTYWRIRVASALGAAARPTPASDMSDALSSTADTIAIFLDLTRSLLVDSLSVVRGGG